MCAVFSIDAIDCGKQQSLDDGSTAIGRREIEALAMGDERWMAFRLPFDWLELTIPCVRASMAVTDLEMHAVPMRRSRLRFKTKM